MGTLTITTTAAQDQRIARAFGTELGLGANANAAQVRQAVIEYLKSVVQRQEIAAARKAAREAAATVTPIDVT